MRARSSSQILFFTQLIPELFRDPISCQFILSCHSAGDPPRNYETCWSQMPLCSLSRLLWLPFESAGQRPRDRAWQVGARQFGQPSLALCAGGQPASLQSHFCGSFLGVAWRPGGALMRGLSETLFSALKVGAGRACEWGLGGHESAGRLADLAPCSFQERDFNEEHWRRPAPTLPRKTFALNSVPRGPSLTNRTPLAF